jgi:hypothetical protein
MPSLSGIFLTHFGATVAVLGYLDHEHFFTAAGLAAVFIGLGFFAADEF